jgi:hypothetical protein
MEKPPVGAGTFCPLPLLVFYISPCRKTYPAWRNVKYHLDEGQNVPAPTGGFFTPKTAIFQRRAFVTVYGPYHLLSSELLEIELLLVSIFLKIYTADRHHLNHTFPNVPPVDPCLPSPWVEATADSG